MTDHWSHILQWRLLKGSHKFPGPDGGTCITEAAIIAAGFEYKSVSSAKDCPPCFSRPIASYAIRLNDSMSDDLRQKLLMPFIMRFAGSADTADVERRRAEYILVGLIRECLPIVLRGRNDGLADQCAAAHTLADAHAAVCDISLTDILGLGLGRTIGLASNLGLALAFAVTSACVSTSALDYAIDLALAVAIDLVASDRASDRASIYDAAVRVLDGALRIGKQAIPSDVACIAERMAAAKPRNLVTVEGAAP